MNDPLLYINFTNYLYDNLQLVESKQANTRVHIYFNNFKVKGKYCADIKARKASDVKNVRKAGVMVYDYLDKS
jgi:hypothetical protein